MDDFIPYRQAIQNMPHNQESTATMTNQKNSETSITRVEELISAEDLKQLRSSGLSDQTIVEMGIYSATASRIRSHTGIKHLQSGGFGIPYHGVVDQAGLQYTRFRTRNLHNDQRYVSSVGDAPEVYVPPGLERISSTSLLIITEGEKKAAKAVQEGLSAIAIAGVYAWADPVDRAVEKVAGKSLSADTAPLSALVLHAKRYEKVLVLGDSDLATKPTALRGLELLRDSLIKVGIRSALALCPPAVVKEDGERLPKKQGLDDWLQEDRRGCESALPALFLAGELGSDGLTDLQNARALHELFRDTLAYSCGSWIRWTGATWQFEPNNPYEASQALSAVYHGHRASLVSLLNRLQEPVTVSKTSPGRTAFRPWCEPLRLAVKSIAKGIARVEDHNGISKALVLAQSLLHVSDDVWDTHTHLLGTPAGVVDLRNGSILPCDPELRITRSTSVGYDPDALAPRFESFLRMVQPDPAVRDYLRRVMGSCAFGNNKEQKFFVFHGPGANGKSVFIDVTCLALGPYATKASVGLIAERGPEHIQNDLASLVGRRLVSVSELPANFRLDEARVKTMTGGDILSARRLYQEAFTFRPQFTLILDTNHHPVIRNPSQGIWRRLVVVPWTTVVAKKDQDKDLATTLRQELPGILAWIVRGAVAFHTNGLETPEAVDSKTMSTRVESDPLQNWLDDYVECRQGSFQQSSEVYSLYCGWAKSESYEEILSQKSFSHALRDKGFQTKKHKGGRIYWTNFQASAFDDEDHQPLNNLPVVPEGHTHLRQLGLTSLARHAQQSIEARS